MKKSYVLLIFILAGLAVLVFFKFIIEFVYIGPYVETANLPYISKSIKQLNSSLDGALRATYAKSGNVKFLYKNAYGSGFIKYNPIPNDLDYEVGIYLGKFEYDGKNVSVISDKISALIADFEYQFYVFSDNKTNPLFYTNMNAVNSLINVSHHRLLNEKLIKQNLPNLTNNNEILTSGFEDVILFSKYVKYNEEMADMPRKIKILFNFTADIVDSQTKQIKRIHFVPKTSVDYSLAKRFFVPSVYTDESSAKFLKNNEYLVNDDEYYRSRMLAADKYISFASDKVRFGYEPLKMYKGLIQTTAIVAPALSEDQQLEVYNYCYTNLNSDTSKALNDYLTAYESLKYITSLPNLYNKMNTKDDISKFISAMNNSLDKINSKPNVDAQKIAALYDKTKEIDKCIKITKTNAEISLFNSKLIEMESDTMSNANAIIIANLKDKNKFETYMTNYRDILVKAGYYSQNPTPEEQKAYSDLKIKMMQDREKFKIKRKFMFVF